MSAGIPGLGLGGLFFIFSALLAPLRQLWRSFKGQSEPGEWRMVGRQFAQAVAMVVAVDLSFRLVFLALAAVGIADARTATATAVIPLTLVGLTTGLLVAVLGTAKLADLAVRVRSGKATRPLDAAPVPPPMPAQVAEPEPSRIAPLLAGVSDPGSSEGAPMKPAWNSTAASSATDSTGPR